MHYFWNIRIHDLLERFDVLFIEKLLDVLQPRFSLNRTTYLCRERIRRSISSFDITWPFRESSRPHSAMRTNVSSHRISSYVASSGYDSITSFIFTFTFAIESILCLRHNAPLYAQRDFKAQTILNRRNIENAPN